ncbi:cyclohexanone monooxygenase, variant 1 [Lophiostoma macrostomum CBS 122681]|uniref:Cyclohexanone monooxygenase, variant 1 n=1 Tax=Lophiostoma macrostomum CBS 122681 TaxID=1314788 RepID=A0A6A6TE33_9PLEO|nr:cyclohexanone monooxygenase, variant 1 [Lophiostoma macrostomum CBS 122681]
MGSAPEHNYDALVVGTGFGGLYSLYLLKQLGLSVRGLETASDVGGTWFWNRYPGARSDIHSHVYRYSWDKELLQTSPWPNNYLHQPEVLAYFQEVARKHALYPLIQFNTELTGADWDEERNVWRAKASSGETFVVRYLVTAVGILHHKNVPQFSGLDEFKGKVVHSSAWDSDIEWEGKRVAVIGSGASGIQIVSKLSEKAQTLTHFIRHAQYVIPSRFRAVSAEERKRINEQYEKIWHDVFLSNTAFGFVEPGRPTLSLAPEDRETVFEDLWKEGNGFRFLFAGFSDLATDEGGNKAAIDFIHRKIKETVKDPQKAEVLTSSDWFARRPLTDDHYYERFNQGNVFAVDVKKTPIRKITVEGIQTDDGTLHPVDLIVLATGFDAVDGSYTRLDLKGRDGISIKAHWEAEGPKSHIGASTSKFPNLFFVNGPGAVFANNPPVAEEGARFARDIIARAEEVRTKEGGVGVVENSVEAENKWQATIEQVAQATLFSKTPSWFFGENIPGKQVAPRFFFGGLGRFRAAIAEEKAGGYKGFQFR